MRLRTKIYIGVGIAIVLAVYLTLTSVIPHFKRYDLLERNNTVLKANQEFYKRQWEEQKQAREKLQTELDGVLVEIDSLKNLKPEIIRQRELSKQKILGLPNSQMQNWYDAKAKQLQK